MECGKVVRWAVLLGFLGAAVLEYSFALSPRASEIVVAQVSGANATTILDTSPSFLAPSFLETSPSIPQTPPSVGEAAPSFLEWSEQKRQPPQLLQAGLNLPSKVSQECLKFIHIPKNAGGTVYKESTKYGYGWSVDDHTLACLRGRSVRTMDSPGPAAGQSSRKIDAAFGTSPLQKIRCLQSAMPVAKRFASFEIPWGASSVSTSGTF